MKEFKDNDLIESKCLGIYSLSSLKYHSAIRNNYYDYLDEFNNLDEGDIGYKVADRIDNIKRDIQCIGGNAACIVLTADLFGNW